MNAVGEISGIGNAVLLILAVFEELQSHLVEQSVGQHVLVLLQVSCGNLGAELLQLGSQIVCGTVGDRKSVV